MIVFCKQHRKVFNLYRYLSPRSWLLDRLSRVSLVRAPSCAGIAPAEECYIFAGERKISPAYLFSRQLISGDCVPPTQLDESCALAGPLFYKLHSTIVSYLPLLICAGPIPKELGALSELNHLWLYGNQLTGVRVRGAECNFVILDWKACGV